MTADTQMLGLRPPAHATLREHALHQLREALMAGRFEPGQRMTIRGLAAALGTSMTPVRDAVGRLAADRALEAEPNRWMRIPILSAAELRELRDIRLALEGLATERAAERVTPQLLAEFEKLEAHIVSLRGLNDPKQMIPAIGRLHFAIYRVSGMPALVQIIEGLWLRSGPYNNLLFRGYTQQDGGALRQATLRALASGQPAEARGSMEADVGRALDWLIALAEGGGIIDSTPRMARGGRTKL